MPVPQLPLELVQLIITAVRDTEALFCCTWVSQLWRKIAHPILLQSFSCLTILSSSSVDDNTSNPVALLQLFQDIWPFARDVVHSVTLSVDSELDCADALDLLMLLPNLRSLELRSPVDEEDWTEFIQLFDDALSATIFPRLASLEIAGYDGIPLCSIIWACRKMTQLVLEDCTCDLNWDSISDITRLLPNVHPLRKLDLSRIDSEEAWADFETALTLFVDLSGCEIHDIRLRQINPRILSFPADFHKSLHTLDLSDIVFLYSLYNYQHISNPMDTLSGIKHIKLGNFVVLKQLKSTILLPISHPRPEISHSFCHWLGDQIAHLPSTHPLASIKLDVRSNLGSRKKPTLWDWDGENPPLPSNWISLDGSLQRRSAKMNIHWSVSLRSEASRDVASFIEKALPLSHSRGILRVELDD
ncbi:hypothetical protein DL96DRAFT_1244966 [Flagelloscypha sp. PMI_526]|nr:hypothetical protein DL96DRAFT_1244966 [Flagelloscypha sp. PMI_526]